MKKTILAIETSCDETGIALVEASGGLHAPKFKVLENLIGSQIKIHRPFGGVVPGLAKREHLKNLPILLKKLLDSTIGSEKKMNAKHSFLASEPIDEAKLHRFYILDSIDLIAVTVGPGLEPALWTGIEFAKTLINADQSARINADRNQRKSAPLLIGVNHMEGHLYSFLLSKKHSNILENVGMSRSRAKLIFPAIALIVSGGHTILLIMESLTKWEKLGETRDDAAGEAFDKVARMLELPYPGGPEIEKLAKKGDSHAIAFPRPMLDQKNYDFSFSGLKTAVLYYTREHVPSTNSESSANLRIRKFETHSLFADVAASFQEAVVDVLTQKTIRAARAYGAKSIILCGGVAANKALRGRLKTESSNLKARFLVPDSPFNTDNAAMIAAAGYFAFLKKKKLPLCADGDLEI